MDDLKWLEPIWDMISNQVHVDKIYLETHRDMVIVDEKTLEKVKKFFHSRGVETAGGITLTVSEMNRFETYCYSNPEHRRKVKEIIELTARHFDEIILDDFFFTDCKCELCIRDKGEMSWTSFRLKQMTEAAHNLILDLGSILRRSRRSLTVFIPVLRPEMPMLPGNIYRLTWDIRYSGILRTSSRAETGEDGLIPEA